MVVMIRMVVHGDCSYGGIRTDGIRGLTMMGLLRGSGLKASNRLVAPQK
jgi:hypothetical protein